MTVGKAEASSLIVAVCRHIKPHIAKAAKGWVAGRIAELRVQKCALVLINEDKKLIGRRPADITKFLPAGDVAQSRHVEAGEVFWIAVDGLAHIVTAITETGQ